MVTGARAPLASIKEICVGAGIGERLDVSDTQDARYHLAANDSVVRVLRRGRRRAAYRVLLVDSTIARQALAALSQQSTQSPTRGARVVALEVEQIQSVHERMSQDGADQ